MIVVMLICFLIAASLARLLGGGFTPTDMTSPPSAGLATGRWSLRPVTDTDRWNQPISATLVGSS